MKYTYTIIALFYCTFGVAQLFNPQPHAMTEKYFPDLELNSPTPAFQKKKGFTTYKEMIAFLEDRAKKHPDRATLSYIGSSQKGNAIPLLHLRKGVSADAIRVWIQAGIHGDEPASTEGVLYLIDQLLENAGYSHLLDRLDIAIVPMGNIDGFQQQERTPRNGLDMNRDQVKLLIPESVALKQAFSDFGAQVAMDFHEYNPFRSSYQKMGKAGYTLPHDVMFLYSGNLNIGASLRQYTEEAFVAKAKQDLQDKKIRSFDYFTPSEQNGYTQYNLGSVNARASATSFALTNCIATLFEVRGVSLGRTSFKRRTLTTFYLALSYLETACRESDNIKRVLDRSVDENKKVVVRSSRETSEQEFAFIDRATNSVVTEKVIVKNALRSKPIKTRKIPTAYILMPGEKDIAAKLQVLGLAVRQLGEEVMLPVENYVVTRYRRESLKYENVYRQEVATKNHKIEKKFPADAYIVYTDQKNRGLLVEVIEPESNNSFTTYGVLKTGLGEELPVYRYTGAPIHHEK